MILFHGTDDFSIAGIRKNGLGLYKGEGRKYDYHGNDHAPKDRDWQDYDTWETWTHWYVNFPFFNGRGACCLTHQPDPWARSHAPIKHLCRNSTRSAWSCGWLVVVEIPPARIKEKVLGTFAGNDIRSYVGGKYQYAICKAYDEYIREAGKLSDDADPDHAAKWEADWKAREKQIWKDYLRPRPVHPDHQWLWERRLIRPETDSMVVTCKLEPEYIMCFILVSIPPKRHHDPASAAKSIIPPQLNPRFQQKTKHKEKTFQSLIWHHVFAVKKKWRFGESRPVILDFGFDKHPRTDLARQ